VGVYTEIDFWVVLQLLQTFMMVAEDVYALKNLLPAGVVRLFFNSASAIATKPPAIESDDWNALTPFLEAHKLHVTTSSLPRLHELDFLVLHRHVRVTWRLPEDALCGFVHVRVYVIPFDLPGAHGLRVVHYREKQKVMLHARKALISLLTETNRSAEAWANYAEPYDGFEPFLSQQHVSCSCIGGIGLTLLASQDLRTLSEIYSDLPSPAVDPSTFLSGTDPRTQRAFRRALHWESPPGMRPLYTYQRRTVARMLQQELDPGIAPDPLYIPIHGVQLEASAKCKTFYLQPSTMEALSECPMRSQAKGGILCEEMGTGKTCIVLGLIIATKHQLSSPEEPLWDEPERPILTPLAFRHFSTRQFECARQVARIKDRPSGIPSLVEMLTHFIRASPEFISPPGFNDSLKEQLPAHLWESLMENHPFYHVFERDPATASSRRKFCNRGPRKVFLTSATLVIVPRAILEQWNSEINKHCEDGSIRHISLDIGPKPRPMPSAQKLASMYDVSSNRPIAFL
jgi:SNF2-related domain